MVKVNSIDIAELADEVLEMLSVVEIEKERKVQQQSLSVRQAQLQMPCSNEGREMPSKVLKDLSCELLGSCD